MNRLWKALLPLTLLHLWLIGCATQPPAAIRETPPGDPPLKEVRSNTKQFIGTQVRWGGTIAQVINGRAESWVEVVGRGLGDNGRPVERGPSQGRFLARFDGFVDPAVFERGREITFIGTVDGSETRTIGEYEYRYPVIAVRSHYLWEPRPDPIYRPYYYDPWWPDPWWRYPHPYWRPYWW